MTALALAAAVFAVLWAVLVIVAQALNPEQSPLSMGMSALARGQAPWVMRASFVTRGLSALLLVAALPTALDMGALALTGLALLWVWGMGSAALALADTDLPGEEPTRAGAWHVWIALVAYVAGVAGAIVLSLALRSDDATAGVARWALPIALAAAVALVAQFAGFGAAARQARSAAALPPGDPSGAPAGTAAPGVPPQLGAGQGSAGRPGRGAGADPGASRGLAGYAGLLQRVFVGLLMIWTLVVALGV